MTTRSRNAMAKHPAPTANRAKADFLQIDSDIALTFAGIALTTKDEKKKQRTTHAARRAYDTIVRLREGVDLTDAENAKLDRALLRLKSELQMLGETF